MVIYLGVDIYMRWDGMTDEEREAQFTGFVNAGKAGYLRGAYFGGLSDVLNVLFSWMNWDIDTVFDPQAFRKQLKIIKEMKSRPHEGMWDDRPPFDERQNAPVPEEVIKDYEDFLKLGEELIIDGKTPVVHISY